MTKHLFKLIWNKKKQNFLLMSEMLVSFLVIFAVFTLMVYYYNNYKKTMGFDCENLWVVNYNNTYQTKSTDSLNIFYENLRQTIKSMPQVKEVSFCSDKADFAHHKKMLMDNVFISRSNRYLQTHFFRLPLNFFWQKPYRAGC